MFKNPNLKLIIIIFSAVAVAVGSFFIIDYFTRETEESVAGWWDDSWNYRQSMSVTSTSTSAQANVYVELTLNTDTASTSMQTDCGDFRFLTEEGEMLDYYISSGCRTSTNVIHVQYTNLPSTENTLYFYYSNSTTENGFSIVDFATEASQYEVGSAESEETGTGPVGYWSFDEGYGSTANDGTANKNTGTITGATWQDESMCVSGKCLYFDGSGDVVVTTDFDLASKITVQAWVKYNSITDDDGIISKRTASENDGNWALRFLDGASSPEWRVWTNPSAVQTQSTIDTSTWTFVVLTFDEDTNTAMLYLNGNLDKEDNAFSQNLEDTPELIEIGHDGQGGYFHGFIDEVKIYNYALTSDEIHTLYNDGLSTVLGGGGTATTTATGSGFEPSFSASRAYCIPGDTSRCDPPVGEWKFDELAGTTAYDTSGQGNDGSFVSDATSPTWTPSGKVGSALDFDGSDDYVNIPSPANSATDIIDGSITISAWVYPEDMNIVRYIVAKADVADNPSRDANYVLQYIYGMPSFYYRGTDEAWHVAYPTTGLQMAMATSTWNHVAVTYTYGTGSSIKFYLNGSEDDGVWGEGDGDELSKSNDEPIWVGRRNYPGVGDGYDRVFDGLIDDVKIYDYARTPAQIAWDYNRGKPIAHWKFDECSGDTIYDESRTCRDGGTCNNGTINLGTSGVTSTSTCASTGSGFWSNGKTGAINSAGSFDGDDDYVVINDTPELRFNSDNQDSAVFAWVKRNTSGGDDEIIDQREANNDGWAFKYDSDDSIQFAVDFTDVQSTTEITDTNWHHVGCIIDRDGNGQIYLDGISDGTPVAINSESMSSTEDLKIGRKSYATDSQFDGLIDEVKIWNYALTPEQIKTEYAGGAVSFGN